MLPILQRFEWLVFRLLAVGFRYSAQMAIPEIPERAPQRRDETRRRLHKKGPGAQFDSRENNFPILRRASLCDCTIRRSP